jgi:predicted nucleic acid-binding protein
MGYDRAKAWEDIRDLRRVWVTILPSWNVLDRSELLLARHSLSFWDAMVIASCLESGIARLYSEDLGSFAQVEGLEIVNPFGQP